MTFRARINSTILLLLTGIYSTSSLAMPETFIEIRNNLFIPQTIVIPAGTKVKITFINHDVTPEEIDSFDLNREKVIFAQSRGSIFVGPLPVGEYTFFGEYHPNSAVGSVRVVRPEEAQ